MVRGDVHCQNCGEPWEEYWLQTEGLKHYSDQIEYEENNHGRIVKVTRCTAC